MKQKIQKSILPTDGIININNLRDLLHKKETKTDL